MADGSATEKVLRRRTLTTKLRPPSRGVRHLPRPRLSRELAGAESFRLALVSAPAGSGKTTMLSEWLQALREAGVGAAWLSLDDFDNDPRRFLVHLVSAVQGARPDFGREALGFLAASPDALMEDVASSLVNDFGRSASPVVIFLDDYHDLRDRTVHGVVEFLLRYVPPHVRFVIGTRKDPPLSIQRLRARGEVLDVGWTALRFDLDETRRYLKEVCRLPLAEAHVRALRDRTEGWAAGLQLAAMSFAGTEDAERFVGGFTGARRDIADYLLEGVFARQPAGVRHFLLRTSILDRMTAPLCEAVSGRGDSQHLIETLENGNLFVFGLDDRRAWYRYHPLFAEFLRNRLRSDLPGEAAGLHDRASDWFEKNGFPTEAARYAVAGRRFARAARLLETAGRELFRQGDFKALGRWIGALPDRTVGRSPLLCALHAWALAYLGELDRARERIARAEDALARAAGAGGGPAGAAPIEAELRVLRAVVGIIRTDEPDVSGLDPGIATLFPAEERALRAYAHITLGFARRVEGNLPRAHEHFQEALEISDAADSSLVNLNARLNIGIVNYLMGRIDRAEESLRRSLGVARERMWMRSIGAAFLRYGLALALQEKNRSAEALDELSEAIEVLEAGDAFGFLGMALVERARVQAALGRADLAGADLARAREVARKHHVARVSFRADVLEAQAALRAGDPARAETLLESARRSFGGVDLARRAVYPEKYESLLIEDVRLLLARGAFDEALRLAGRALRSARQAGRGRNVVEFLVLQAAARNGLARGDEAVAALEEALSLAEPEGIVRPFVLAGPGIIPLVRRVRGPERLRAAATAILAALEGRGDPASGKAAAGRPEASFHHREVQILGLMSQGLRNREIGRRLFLSEETVKWYLKRLYATLDVKTRTEAVASARKRGLLA